MKTPILLCCAFLSTVSAFAQPFNFNPRQWQPLTVGSYWHYYYEDTSFPFHEIWHISQDTLVDGIRWFAEELVYCSISPFCSGGTPPTRKSWHGYTDDHYLLSSSSDALLTNPDTPLISHTAPSSIFIVFEPESLFLNTRLNEPMLVKIETEGEERADSTHFRLIVSSNIYFLYGQYIYNVGWSEDLVGAIVGEVVYGDVSFIESFLVGVQTDAHSVAEPTLNVYPNPAQHEVYLEAKGVRAGWYEAFLIDLLGREVPLGGFVLSGAPAAEKVRLALNRAGLLRSGVYVLAIRSPGNPQYHTKLVLAR